AILNARILDVTIAVSPDLPGRVLHSRPQPLRLTSQVSEFREAMRVDHRPKGVWFSLQRFTLELRTLLSFSLDFLASSVGLVCDPRVNRCNPHGTCSSGRTWSPELPRPE